LRLIWRQTFDDNFEDRQHAIGGTPEQRTTSDSTIVGTVVRLWIRDPDFRALVLLVFLTLLTGTIFYSLQEGWSLIDAFYFSVTTLTTVGLGDPTPTTPIGKLFTVGYIFSGLGLIAGFINAIAAENLSRRTRRGRNEGDQEDAGEA
jgi:voltage-gated potassium channel